MNMDFIRIATSVAVLDGLILKDFAASGV